MIRWNGVDLLDHFDKILDIRRDILPPRMLRTQEAPGRDGVYLAGVTRGARIIEVDVLMIDRSHSSLRQRVEEVASILDKDEPVPMEIADEPDRIRYVILSEETDLEEIVHTGRTTLRFFMPDPWKVSKEEKFKGITSPPVTFERQSTADDPEGMVPPQQPRYREGKFGQGIFIEEGTTNLLSTPENPAVEEVDVQAGETYTLSHDMGRVGVGHHREEDLSAGEFHNVRLVEGKLVLNKYGEDRKEDLNIASRPYMIRKRDGSSWGPKQRVLHHSLMTRGQRNGPGAKTAVSKWKRAVSS